MRTIRRYLARLLAKAYVRMDPDPPTLSLSTWWLLDPQGTKGTTLNEATIKWHRTD